MPGHTWKGVEELRELRYGAGVGRRCKFNDKFKFNADCRFAVYYGCL